MLDLLVNTKRQILIVDDNHEFIASLEDILDSDGFSVICAFDGQQAIQRVIEKQPPIVLMDVQMPIMDGLTALKKIKQLFPLTHVWMMTGYLALDLTPYPKRLGDAG